MLGVSACKSVEYGTLIAGAKICMELTSWSAFPFTKLKLGS